MNTETESSTMNNNSSSLDHISKPRKPKARQISSRFLSPTSNSSLPSSPNHSISPIRRKNAPSSSSSSQTATNTDTRKHRSVDQIGSTRGLWPSSSGINTISSSNEKFDTLADHLGRETLRDFLGRKDHKNATDYNLISSNSKENDRPIIGGSMRFDGGRFRYREKTSSSFRKSVLISSSNNGSPPILPGRLSVDENTLNRQRSDSFVDSFESESSEKSSNSNEQVRSLGVARKSSASYMSSTVNSSSRISRFDNLSSSTQIHGKILDSNDANIVESDNNSPKLKRFTIKNAIKRTNSLTGYGGTTASQWTVSPGSSNSAESKGKSVSFSNLKPQTSPSRATGVEKFINMGLDLFKSKKSSSFSSSILSPIGSGISENVHQLRLLHNRLIQWRFVNARSVAANESLSNQAEISLTNAWKSIIKLRQSVQQKKLQLQKEQLEAKLNFLLHSQIKPLEAWTDMERQHLSALLKTQNCLHSVVCRVPLIEGVKADTKSTSIALRHASDLSASIQSMVASFSPEAEKIVKLMSELAKVVAQEKAIIEECFELLSIVKTLEVEEKSLRCYLIQEHR